MIKDIKISTYLGALIITIFGAGAALLIVDAANAAADAMEYAHLHADPANPEAYLSI